MKQAKNFKSFIFCLFVVFTSSVFAIQDKEESSSPQPEISLYDLSMDKQKKVIDIASEIHCPVCDGETVYTSNAAVALEMKQFIINEVSDDKSSEEIIDKLIDVYGDNIIFNKNFSSIFILYLIPFMVIIIVLLKFRSALIARK